MYSLERQEYLPFNCTRPKTQASRCDVILLDCLTLFFIVCLIACHVWQATVETSCERETDKTEREIQSTIAHVLSLSIRQHGPESRLGDRWTGRRAERRDGMISMTTQVYRPSSFSLSLPHILYLYHLAWEWAAPFFFSFFHSASLGLRDSTFLFPLPPSLFRRLHPSSCARFCSVLPLDLQHRLNPSLYPSFLVQSDKKYARTRRVLTFHSSNKLKRSAEMAPSCFVDPMDCILLHKRAPPTTAPEPTSHVAVIVGASVGSLALVMALAIFYCCMRKRRASRRIGQLQRFLPTFMDQEKTAKYFQTQGSSSTLVPAIAANGGQQQEQDSSSSLSPPSNVHHRTRSAPIAFAKGVTDHRNRQLQREGSLGQFQQISLISEETVVEGETPSRRSISSGRARAATTINNTAISIVTTTPPGPAQVVSSLHRSVSLNKYHGPSSPIHSRAGPLEPEQLEEEDHQEKFAEGESLVAPNRFSALLDFNDNRFSNLSTGSGGLDPDYMDPTRFSTQSILFDAKRISNQSHSHRSSSSDESVSSDEFNKNLPPHQQHHSFHSHDNDGMVGDGGRSREASGAEYPASVAATAQSYYGDKQELEDDDQEFIPRRIAQPIDNNNGNYYGNVYYPPLTQQQHQQQQMMPQSMPMPMPMPMPAVASSRPINRAGVPLPENIRMSRPFNGSPDLMDNDRQQGPRY